MLLSIHPLSIEAMIQLVHTLAILDEIGEL
jgi:hypothetical protein